MPPRVVSLLSSSTEIVCALGCGDWLVGRSHECDFPASVLNLPVCSEPTIDVHGSSREIDKRVKQSLRDALSIYRVHAQTLQELRPDVVFTQTQCEVCAVSLSDVEQAVCNLIGSRPRIVSVEPHDLEGVWGSMRQIAAALGVAERGERLIAHLQARLEALRQRVQTTPERPRVACLEWIDPIMGGGNWLPDLVRIAGGDGVLSEGGRHSTYSTWEQLREADPDVIVAIPCGWGIPKAREEMSTLTRRPDWPNLNAVRHRRVYLADGNQFFNRSGPRLVESAEILAEILQPAPGRCQHEGSGWIRFE